LSQPWESNITCMWFQPHHSLEGVSNLFCCIYSTYHILHRTYLTTVTPDMMRLVTKCIFPKYSNNVSCKIMYLNGIIVHLCASEYGMFIYIISLSICDLAVKSAKPATCSYGDNYS
jgi:hypothetical protein